jgi:hypothetical protein
MGYYGGLAMVFENRTISEIRTLLINEFQSAFNNKLRILPKSFIKIFSTILAGVFIFLYKQIGWVFLQIFPETAYWGEVTVLGLKIRPLVKWGVLIGVGEPKSGTTWKGKIIITVLETETPLTAGTQLKSDITGKIYLIDSTVTLESETALADITCAETGSAGNMEPGDLINFVSPLGNVEKAATVDTVTEDAIDDETEADYRFRVVNRWRMQPQGGALADYRIWGAEVSGVLNIYPYGDPDSPSGVFVFVSGNPAYYPNRIPSAALLILVGKACTYNPETGQASRKPLTAKIDPLGNETYINVKPVEIEIFDIYINGVTGIPALDFANTVRSPLEEYFLGREPYIRGLSDDNNKTNLVSKNNVASVVDQIAISEKAEFDNVVMYHNGIVTPTYNLSLDDNGIIRMGKLAKLGSLYINGEQF